MKRTLRLLAAPAATMLLLASCGTAGEPAPAEDGVAQDDVQADAEPSDAGGEEKSSGELQADHAKENSEGEGMEAGAPETFPLTDEPFFASTTTGALITMTMKAQPESSEEIAWLEQYREDAGGDPVTYILSDVDNRDGSDPVNMYATTMYDQDGQSYECEMAIDYVEENWQPVWLYGSTDVDEYESASGEPMEHAVGEELDSRLRDHQPDDTVDPFESGAIVSICPETLPQEVTAVEVMPGGIYIDPTYATPESYMGEDG